MACTKNDDNSATRPRWQDVGLRSSPGSKLEFNDYYDIVNIQQSQIPQIGEKSSLNEIQGKVNKHHRRRVSGPEDQIRSEQSQIDVSEEESRYQAWEWHKKLVDEEINRIDYENVKKLFS